MLFGARKQVAPPTAKDLRRRSGNTTAKKSQKYPIRKDNSVTWVRTGESITVALSPFAPRKGVLSRSERRHLFRRRSLISHEAGFAVDQHTHGSPLELRALERCVAATRFEIAGAHGPPHFRIDDRD